MKKLFILFRLLALLPGADCIAQNDDNKNDSVILKNLLVQANKMADAFIKEDYETFVAFTHPVAVKMVGGKEKVISTLKRDIGQMKQEGFTFKSVKVSNPTRVVQAGKELHCLIAQTILITITSGTLQADSWLLCVSGDNGQNWHFVDTAPLTNENVKTYFPDFNTELVIPEKKEPVFIENGSDD